MNDSQIVHNSSIQNEDNSDDNITLNLEQKLTLINFQLLTTPITPIKDINVGIK